MKITRRQLSRLIRETFRRILEEQGCAETEAGCVREDEDGTWYILDNKKGGVWRKGFKTKKSALSVLKVPGVHGG